MKTLIQKDKLLRQIGNKVVIALILVSAISVLSLSSAFADRDGEHHGHGHHHGHGYQREYQQPYGYGYGSRQPYGVPARLSDALCPCATSLRSSASVLCAPATPWRQYSVSA